MVTIVKTFQKVIFRVVLFSFVYTILILFGSDNVFAQTESGKYFQVLNDDTRVYFNTGKGLEVIGTLTKNEEYQIKSAQKYYYVINFGNKSGLVKKSDTKLSSGTSIKNKLNKKDITGLQITILRDSAVFDSKTGYSVFGHLKKDLTFPVVVSQRNWWGVEIAGRLGFIPKSNAVAQFKNTDKYFVANEDTDVYHNTKNGFVKVGSIKKGQLYLRVGDRTNWHLIEFGNQMGYVKKSATEPVFSPSIKNLLITSKTEERRIIFRENAEVLDSKSNYAVFGLVERGVSYPVVVSQKNWWGINVGGRLGFVRKSAALKEFFPTDKYFRVVSETTDVYHNVNGNFVKVGELIKNQEFQRVTEQTNWHLIDFGTQLGYVKKMDTEPSTGASIKNKQRQVLNKKITILNDANVYDTSSGKYVSFAKLKSGNTYQIIFEQKNWWGINVGGRAGVISKSSASNRLIETTQYNLSFDRMVEIQMAANPKSDGAGKKAATEEEVRYYLNPKNFREGTKSFYQFLVLDKPTKVSAQELNVFLKGKGILDGHGEDFVKAGEKYGINELYLIGHAIHETGAGTSTLSRGVSKWTKLVPGTCTPVKDKNGKVITVDISPKKVYNMYGISAYDNCVVDAGAQYAYDNGWFTPSAAIIGGAGFVSKSYFERGQNTLYKMRWDPKYAELNNTYGRQYATHVAWADIQAKKLADMYAQLNSYFLYFDVPKYLNQPNSNTDKNDSEKDTISYPKNTVGVTLVNLNLRKGPSTSYERITVLNKGTIINVIESQKNWLKVKVMDSNLEGWVSKGQEESYVEFLNLLEVNVNEGSRLNVRSSPDGEIIGTLENKVLVAAKLDKENKLIITSKGGYMWYEIFYQGRDAYIAGEYIKQVK